MTNDLATFKPANNIVKYAMDRMGELATAEPLRALKLLQALTNKNAQLAACTKESVFVAFADCVALDLEPGREAHFVAFGNTCTLIADYRGLIKILTRTGAIKQVRTGLIFDGDEHAIEEGSTPRLVHRPDLKAPHSHGTFVAAYAIAEFADGRQQFTTRSRAEVDAVRKMSKSGSRAPWADMTHGYFEMARKTAIRHLAKYINLPRDIAEQIDRADRGDYEFRQLPLQPEPSPHKPTTSDLNAAFAPVEPKALPAPEPEHEPIDAAPPAETHPFDDIDVWRKAMEDAAKKHRWAPDEFDRAMNEAIARKKKTRPQELTTQERINAHAGLTEYTAAWQAIYAKVRTKEQA